MLHFIDVKERLVKQLNASGANPKITQVLAKLAEHTYESQTLLTDDVVLVVRKGGGMIPEVEIQNQEGWVLAQTMIGFWEHESEFLLAGYKLLDRCNLSDKELKAAQAAIDIMLCDYDDDDI